LHNGSGLQETNGLLCCSWSPDGSFIVAGGHDCCAYIWLWDVCRQRQQQKQQVQQQHVSPQSSAAGGAAGGAAGAAAAAASQQVEQQPPVVQQQQSVDAAAAAMPAGNPFDAFRQQLQRDLQQKQQQQQERRRSRRVSSSSGTQQPSQPPQPAASLQESAAGLQESAHDAAFPPSSADWPAPVELQRLCGHRNEIVQAEFSNSGAMLATASLDGSVRVSARNSTVSK
jgi:WD40 repeat protein